MSLQSFLSTAKMPCLSSKTKPRNRPSRTLMLSTTPSSGPLLGQDSPHQRPLGVCGRSPPSGPARSIPSSLEMEPLIMQRPRQFPPRAPRRLTSISQMARRCSTHCALRKSNLHPPLSHHPQLHLHLLQPCSRLLQLLPRASL